MKSATLCIPLIEKDRKILLGMKKRGFGEGKYNGFGGKLLDTESIEEAAVRELREESGIRVLPENLIKCAEIKFFCPSVPNNEWDQVVSVFLVEKWEETPSETEEMMPEWFSFDEIPYKKMWQDDSHWLPLVLSGKKIKATFVFKEDNENIGSMNIEEVKVFEDEKQI
ncbi:MAG: 8-oxo-dGTP diphosphatase [Candidatus Woesearchaeota archaeon]|nr:8-oxo-dGTP diphosphatase [Candidatus Woesearchaeota archaeon]